MNGIRLCCNLFVKDKCKLVCTASQSFFEKLTKAVRSGKSSNCW